MMRDMIFLLLITAKWKKIKFQIKLLSTLIKIQQQKSLLEAS